MMSRNHDKQEKMAKIAASCTVTFSPMELNIRLTTTSHAAFFELLLFS